MSSAFNVHELGNAGCLFSAETTESAFTSYALSVPRNRSVKQNFISVA